MSGFIRPHQLSEGAALQRRVIEELFFDAARRLDSPDGTALGDNVLRRVDFEPHTWFEMYGSYATGLDFRTPQYAYVVPDSLRTIRCDDTTFEAKYTWSALIEVTTTSKYIWAFPVVDGVPIYGALDFLGNANLIKYISPDPANPAVDPSDEANEQAGDALDGTIDSTISGSGTVTGRNGTSAIGLIVFSVGIFKIKRFSSSLVVSPR